MFEPNAYLSSLWLPASRRACRIVYVSPRLHQGLDVSIAFDKLSAACEETLEVWCELLGDGMGGSVTTSVATSHAIHEESPRTTFGWCCVPDMNLTFQAN